MNAVTLKKLAITAYVVNILFRVAANEIGPYSCLAAPFFASFFVNCVYILLSSCTEISSIVLNGSRRCSNPLLLLLSL